jgi:hypothetical protein
VETQRDLYQQLKDAALSYMDVTRAAWENFSEGTLDIARNWFTDLADTSMSGEERFNAVMQGMARLALGTIWDMVRGWIAARTAQIAVEKVAQAAMVESAATATAASATESAASATVTAAKSTEAVSKAAAAYGWWPFIGGALLGAFVALLVASMAKFEAGGVVGGGSGTHDDVPSLLLRGEGVVNRRGMATLGADGLAALNSGVMLAGGGGGDTINLTVNADGGDPDAVERMVNDKLVPALEDLFERRRVNLSGSRLRRA